MSKVRHIAPIYLYNMLQDFRHLLIFDLRPEKDFEQIYIRDSFNVNEQSKCTQISISIETMQQVIQRAQLKATEKETKYKQLKRVRRFFFVGQKKVSEDDEIVKEILDLINLNSSKDDKIYSLDNQFAAFSKTYPFMCLTKVQLQKVKLFKSQNQQQQADKVLLYPYSKFPSQIILNKLYLGNVYSSNSQIQLQDLGIKGLVDFIDYKEDQKIPQFKQAKYSYLHLPFNNDVQANIDFDLINQELDKELQKGKTLFYCKDGQVISPAFVISYLMYKCKLDVNMATLKVCQAISRVEICKWIYTQLLTYKPKK